MGFTFYDHLVRPLLFRLDAETAHDAGMLALRSGLASPLAGTPLTAVDSAAFGAITRFGLNFRNPLGMAAGFDKNGLVVRQLLNLGFGFVEVGTVTFEPQPGNPRPRLFRLPSDQALINRFGFNNDGARTVIDRLKATRFDGIVGVNIGRNKTVANDAAIDNYLASLEIALEVADYVAVNVSSPNTPNLRDLQSADHLETLLGELQRRNAGRRPLLVKIAPDLDEKEIEAVVGVAVDCGIDGLIATNTTVSRDGLTGSLDENGGLSGRPLRQRATNVIEQVFRLSQGKLPIVGVGGIFTAADAFEKIAAGACLIQAYTGFVYRGPSFATDLIRGLASILQERGFASLDEVVGSGVKLKVV